MRLGGYTFLTDESLPPGVVAAELETRGFESLFLPEHTHMPTNPTPRPTGQLGRHYSRTLDPFIALTAAAAATSRLRLGTAVTLAAQRDPIVLAKEVATLDHLSGGRVHLGVGAGWNRPEMANHGVVPATRTRLLAEKVEAMRRIWTEDIAEFHGELVDFGPLRSWPKPRQRPHPPLCLGGWGPTTVDRVVACYDGWLVPPGSPPERIERGVAEMRALAVKARRDPPEVTVFVRPSDPVEPRRLAAFGVDRVLLYFTADSLAGVRPVLDAFAGRFPCSS
jgi:probable F420-dependent oxidoreductase